MALDDETRMRAAAPRGEPPAEIKAPSISLPKAGGALRGIGEKLATNPVNGTARLTIPIPTSAGRFGFGPQLALAYDSGAANGPFGLGWDLGLPAIGRRTDKGLPRYGDHEDSDIFVLSDAEDLVPAWQVNAAGEVVRDGQGNPLPDTQRRDGYEVRRYLPRIEGGFARIERWTRDADGDAHWRVISRENVTTLYGKTAESRIADPAAPDHVFKWLICQSYDDKGNAIVYEYAAEDGARIFEAPDGSPTAPPCERNRSDAARGANRYPKRIKYGNRTPNRDAADRPTDPTLLDDWMFEVLFDYDEGHLETLPDEGGEQFRAPHLTAPAGARWSVRQDPFSSYRAGFEVRTYRLCRRVLMFHHFPVELGAADALVSTTELNYDESPVLTRLTSAVQGGYLPSPTPARADRYLRRTVPALTMTYSELPTASELAAEPARRIDAASAFGLPEGLEGGTYRFVDLDGEGAAGVLTEQGGAWWYKRNLSATNLVDAGDGARAQARLGPPLVLAAHPRVSLGDPRTQLVDLEGDGQLDVMIFGDSPSGSYERTLDLGWSSFRPFSSPPNVEPTDANLRVVDLDGDGRADILVTDQDAFTWYQALGQAGFAPSVRVPAPADDERGARLVFADGEGAIHLADMSGDGLSDLVRVRNGEVCYWPNLGYGRFGAKVTLGGARAFDAPELFEPRRVRLADTDGSGTTDVVYLGTSGVKLYLNQSGNSLAAPLALPQLPLPDDLARVDVVDLLGTGTACLVWSSSLASDAGQPLRYVDLMRGEKPHLLLGFSNQLGSETELEYKPSTYFYQADLLAGRPWATRLPFPVQCVSRVVTRDRVRETVFETTYAYRNGHYDGFEREFRGFARVDQVDTATYAEFKLTGASNVVEEDLHQTPVLVKTWFHTGAWLDEPEAVLHGFRDEYYQNAARPEQPLPEPRLPDGLDAGEHREALRALKGLTLRQEIYALDDTAQAPHPYATSEASSTVALVQPRAGNRNASFLVSASENVTRTYERIPDDPNVVHSLVLEVDRFGIVKRSAEVAYPRAAPDPTLPAAVRDAQARLHVGCRESDLTNDVDGPDDRRLRVELETRQYELTGYAPPAGFATLDSLREAVTAATRVPYEAADADGLRLRLLERRQALFLADDLSGPLPLGTLGARGLPFQTFQLATTAGLAAQYYGAEVPDAAFEAAGYVHRGDTDWWVPSGTSTYPAGARGRFYLADGFVDPLGTTTTFHYDAHALLVVDVTDALGSSTVAEHDYRMLSPFRTTDVNGNRSEVETDALGVVVRAATMGKVGATDGDTLADPTVRVEYDLFNWRDSQRPNFVHLFKREQHGAANTRFQESFVYQDGGGATVMVKAQAEPGLAKQVDPTTGAVVEVDTTPAVRWVGSGRTVHNNKGNVVKQYEPYFSVTPEFETARELVGVGFTPIITYDAVGRAVRLDMPDGTFSRTEWSAWQHRRFDPNDTVLESRWYADRGSPDPNGPEPADPETRAAWLAAKHAGTPAVLHADNLGRTVLAIADNGAAGLRPLRSEMDLSGRFVEVFDARERSVARIVTNMIGAAIFGDSAERGERRTFTNVLGQPVKSWDGRGRFYRNAYDVLHRVVDAFFRQDAGAEIAFGHLVYGEALADGAARNLRGRPHQMYDQAGVARFEQLDFKGNLVDLRRRFARDYRAAVDWTALVAAPDVAAVELAAEPLLEAETFTGSSSYDALNRPLSITLADGTVVTPHYNEGNHLGSLEAQLAGQAAATPFVVRQEHDVRGRRSLALLGNGLTTRSLFDPVTLRLARVTTARDGGPAGDSLQDLSLTYDPVGNVTRLFDGAQQTHFFRNAVVSPEWLFEHDALYELTRASGREHAGLGGDVQRGPDEIPTQPLPHTNDAAAVRNYTETYSYDELGNLLTMRHVADGGSWTRRYHYAYQDDATDRTNRLVATSLPGDPDAGPFSARYTHDASGNMTAMPHLASLEWGFLDTLRSVDLGGGGRAFYVYGPTGQRLRKVIERQGGRTIDRLYLGAVEIRRESVNGAQVLERRTVHVFDDVSRIAQVDTKTVDTGGADPAPLGVPVTRYVYTNHLSSATLETDDAGEPISYEEFHPFGTTAYWSARPGSDISLKRFRYVGKEHDDETGLYYFGARYSAPWLGRWTSADPAGFADGLNQYAFTRNNPVTLADATGTQSESVRIVKVARTTGRESFEEVQALSRGIAGYHLNPEITPENYQSYYIPGHGPHGARGVWNVLVAGDEEPPPPVAAEPPASETPEQQAPVVTGAPATSAGEAAVRTNPEGFTLEVPNNFDDEKIAAYRERIRTDRGVAHRSADPATGERTADIRGRSQGLRDAYETQIGGRGAGNDIDHTVELQHIGRHNDTVRPQDHRPQASGLNRSQGRSARTVADRQIAGGVPEDVPAGGVARTSEMGRLVNRPGFRTAARGVGYGLMVAGPFLTAYGASAIENQGVRYTGYGLAAAEAVGVGIYGYGRIVQGGGAAGAAAGRATMALGSRVAMAAGGAAQALISGYFAYEDYQNKDWVAFGFDAASAVGGVALVAAAVVSAPALAVGLAVVGIATGVAAGVFHLGRWANWW
jgi:RHS repeat-associated protein